jgi:reactive intermediate/imine deaminase
MPKVPVFTDRAPAAIGTYSQAIKAGGACYISGQIGLDPATGDMVPGGIEPQIARVFDNLKAVAGACGGTLAHAVKVNVYLIDLVHFAKVNEAMAKYFEQPYPARAAIGVASLPRGALVEADCVLVID